MNDKTNPVGETASPAPSPTVPPTALRPAARPFLYWIKKLLVCNPFYIASAALLLYGVHRLALEPQLFATELRQLTFNFAALQVYELLLAGTATFLAARRIYYDATLLVALENLLWIVPFILVNQAAFIAPQLALFFCSLAVLLAAGRVGWVRTRAGELLPPGRVLWCAGPLVLVNAAWPVVYRHFGETKLGGNIEGAAYDCNEAGWFWLLPLLAAVLLVLPRAAAATGTSRLPRWFPLLLFGFWLTGTAVHLYSLGYVYDFKLRREQLTPVLAVLAWGLACRWEDFFAPATRAGQRALLVLPALATLPAALAAESRVFFVVSAINFVAYGVLLLWRRDRELVVQLGLISFAATVATVPVDFTSLVGKPLTPTNLVGLAALIYVVVGAVFSRNPKVALLGAGAAMIVAGVVRQTHADWFHWAVQAGLAYFLAHSFRWRDTEHAGAAVVRVVLAAIWVAHTYVWVHQVVSPGVTLLIPGLMLAGWAARGWIMRQWQPLVLPLAAGLALLGAPVNFLIGKSQAAPAGVLYLVGSFGLFGVGTLAALTKHRWHKHPSA